MVLGLSFPRAWVFLAKARTVPGKVRHVAHLMVEWVFKILGTVPGK